MCLCCSSPANSNSSVASEQEERFIKNQIQSLHNQQFCSSQNPLPVLQTHFSFIPIFFPSHAYWQSPPIILFSSHSNSSSQLSSLVPRPADCLSPSISPVLYLLPQSLPPPLCSHHISFSYSHNIPSCTSNFTNSGSTNQEY